MKIKSIIFAITTATLLSACQDDKAPAPTYATVTSVEPITEQVQTPHQVCKDVVVTTQAEIKDENKLVGTLGGAAAGAALGNQVGGGSGKTIATAVGTVAGAMTGRKIQDNAQKNDVVTTTQRQCNTQYTTSSKTVGYNVTYDLGGTAVTAKTINKPQGNILPIVDGKVILPE